MIGYVTVGANDLPRMLAFYETLLGEQLGARRLIDNEESFGFVMLGVDWTQPGFAVTRPHDGAPATPGNGAMTAFVVETRAKVDAFHARALELGGSDEGAPGVRGEEGPQAFYGAYARDPEGAKFCVFRVGPA